MNLEYFYWNIIFYNVILVLLYQNMNQPYVYRYAYPHPLEPPSHAPHPTPLRHPRALNWAPCAIWGNFPQAVYFTQGSVYSQCYSLNSSHSLLPLCVHKSILSIRVSISAHANSFICIIFPLLTSKTLISDLGRV